MMQINEQSYISVFSIIENPDSTYPDSTYSVKEFTPNLRDLPILTGEAVSHAGTTLENLEAMMAELKRKNFTNLNSLYSIVSSRINDFFSAWQHMLMQDMLLRKNVQVNSEIFYWIAKLSEKMSVELCLGVLQAQAEKINNEALNSTIKKIQDRYAREGKYYKWEVLQTMRLIKKQSGNRELSAELKNVIAMLNNLFEIKKAPEGIGEGLYAEIKPKRAGYTPADALPFWAKFDRKLKLIIRALLVLGVIAYIVGHICFPPLVVFSGLAVCALTLAIISRRVFKWLIRSIYYGRPFLSKDQIKRGIYNLVLGITNVIFLCWYAMSIKSLGSNIEDELNIFVRVVLHIKKICYNIGYNTIGTIQELFGIKSSSEKLSSELSRQEPVTKPVGKELSFGQKIGTMFLTLYMMLSWSLSGKKKFASDSSGDIANDEASVKEILVSWLKFCGSLLKSCFKKTPKTQIAIEPKSFNYATPYCDAKIADVEIKEKVVSAQQERTTDWINQLCNEYITRWEQKQNGNGRLAKLPSGVKKIQSILESNKDQEQKIEEIKIILDKKVAKAEAENRGPDGYIIKRFVTPAESLEFYRALQKELKELQVPNNPFHQDLSVVVQ